MMHSHFRGNPVWQEVASLSKSMYRKDMHDQAHSEVRIALLRVPH